MTITFDDSDSTDAQQEHHDGIVISLPIGNALIKRILIDNGSSANVLFLEALQEMGLQEKSIIRRSTVLVGFSGESLRTVGEISLPTYAEGATYERLVNKMFKDRLGDTMEVYIDDMLVKSRKVDDHVEHLRQSFDILRKYGMKLNPTKCSFGVSAGKFLGRVAALNRFISRSSDKCRLLYDVLRKNKGFSWSDDHETALQNLKKYMMSPPLLFKPKEGEVLQLYLAVSSTAVSAVLAREDETQQLPIYYISKSLLEAETRYSSLEKLVLALVTAAKKLRHYFETHQIVVMTNYPIKSVMRRPELTGRMEKWTMALGSFDIKYQPRTAVKSQALADFVVDFSPDLEKIADDEVKLINNVEEIWTLIVDGSSNFRGACLGAVLKSPQGDMIAQAICCDFKAMNNETEYEVLIAGLTLADELGASGLNIFSDSQLIVNQINGDYEAKDLKMTLYLEKAKTLASKFKPLSIKQVPRDLNTQADALANLGSALRKSPFSTIPLVHLLSPAVEKDIPQDASLVLSTTNTDSWTKPILDYLTHETLPDDKLEARKILFKASRYVILQGILFKRSANGMLMRCAGKTEWERLQKQYHEGECGRDEGGRSLSTRIKRNGYYWPTMLKHAMRYVAKCDKCQRHASMTHKPSEFLHPTLTPWPFIKWGMDIVGKLPVAPGRKVFMLALTDYFSKWIEADSEYHQKSYATTDHNSSATRLGLSARHGTSS
ncbi:uncharacterized protein [Spinacia oleracea]|uniref:RNase H type-1 domain-containing protein n=1 Tax=Spinacia oleracea TaxID=3562 RepID=A0ABM3R838_SPIOL|nr:uncharacterized protein LOC130467322 [Spinacia oleracea]